MKNNMLRKTLALSFLLITSCTRQHSRYANGELSLIDKRLAELAPRYERALADTKSDACVMDELTEGRLFEDIRNLENSKIAPSKTILNGIDLSKFPPNQAYYLEKNKDWIFPKDVNVAGCNDLQCIFSKIYPVHNGMEGYLNYYIYLKTGYIVATSLPVPGVRLDPPQYSNKDILFSLEELKNFYVLTKALPSSFFKMSTLSSIHRMPLKTRMPDTEDSPNLSKACGIAGGYVDKGYVVLMDECLTRTQTSLFGGNFFPLVTHELAHRLDYTLLPEKKVLSETSTWLALSGWTTIEKIDAQGKATLQWVSGKPEHSGGGTPDGFYRDYTATSPVEDFADSVGYARYAPEEVALKSPRKFAWVSKNVFGGRAYSPSGLTASYTRIIADKALNDMPVIVNSCVENNSAFIYRLSAENEADYKDYDPKLIECIFGGIERVTNLTLKEIKKNEPEACGYFTLNEALIKERAMDELQELIKKDLGKNVEISKQLMVIAEFNKRLKEELYPREIFIACQDPDKIAPRGGTPVAKNPLECFSDELSAEFKLIASDYADKIPHQIAALEASYLTENSYVQVKDALSNLFGQIFVGSDLKFKDFAKKQWKVCMEEQTPENLITYYNGMDLTLYPFNGGNQYIKKSLLNCFNNDAVKELDAILSKTGKRIGIELSNPVTKKFVLDMYLPYFTSTLQDLVIMGKNLEAQRINEKKSATTQQAIATLIDDTAWIGNEARSSRDLYGVCQEKSKENIEKDLANEEVEEFNFHMPSNLWSDSVCSSVMTSTKIVKLIESNQTKAVKKAIPRLSTLILEEAVPTMTRCRNQFIKNNTLIVKSRNLCLTNPMTWGSIEDESIRKWIAEEKIDFIPFAAKLGEEHLSAHKSSLKDQAIKKMNAPK